MELIAAVDRRWGIGYKGQLLARVRGDLRHFKTLTEGKTVILGSNTLLTFPDSKPLKNRKNVILHPDASYKVEGATVLHSTDELLEYVAARPDEKFIVIGGASVYRQLLPYCDEAFITRFERTFEADAFFEDLDALPDFRLASQSEPMLSDPATDTVGDMPYVFLVYRRIR